MRQSLVLRQQMLAAIKCEITERTKRHQTKVAMLNVGTSNLKALGAPLATKPLVLLAHGDSWFDYPLSGNDLSLSSTDVIAQLETLGAINPIILNISHHGDATTDEMSLPKQQRLIESLQDASNWPDGKPDAILFSGGGNDIAGDQFCIFLDYAITGATGLNAARFANALEMIEASYLDLFAFRDRYAPNVPIFGHSYDFPVPNGAHPACAGPWLRPSLTYCGWNDVSVGASIVHQALTGFAEMLIKLAAVPANNFILVETQGTFTDTDWANELHPYPDGFKQIAEKFVSELRQRFPNRI